MSDDCFVCRKIRGELPPPGGPLYEDDRVYASHIFDVKGRGDPPAPARALPDMPRDLRWHEVDEWEGAPRGGPEEIAATVDRVRSRLRF